LISIQSTQGRRRITGAGAHALKIVIKLRYNLLIIN